MNIVERKLEQIELKYQSHSSNIEFKTIPYQEIEKYRKIKQKWIDKAEEKGLY